MDAISFLSSINKLSVFAFLITFGVLIYELRQFKKDQRYRAKPKIPKFDQSTTLGLPQATALVLNKKKKITKANNFVIIVILVVLLIVFGLAAFFGFSKISSKTTPVKEPMPQINFIASKGIKIYDGQFNPISDTKISKLVPGGEIIIGVETIKDIDIDRARIRVNKNKWESQDITVDFDSEKNVYYIRYIIASDESKLKIEAQLHSVTDGWLGD